ncbi:MAG TPA: competence protein TfoX [Clostridium sp.]|nr:competence protein TfoX [Clostridium sp.]
MIGDITTRKMMGEYIVYYRGKHIGDICDNRFLVKRTSTSDRLLADCRLEYPYEGSKTLLYLVEEVENVDMIRELLEGFYTELPERKKK